MAGKYHSMDWYIVVFDETGFTRRVAPPGGEAWTDSVTWDEIVRVCLEMEGLYGSDSLFVFTATRPESYQMPLQAESVQALLSELIQRRLFDAQLAIDATLGEGVYCWPKND